MSRSSPRKATPGQLPIDEFLSSGKSLTDKNHGRTPPQSHRRAQSSSLTHTPLPPVKLRLLQGTLQACTFSNSFSSWDFNLLPSRIYCHSFRNNAVYHHPTLLSGWGISTISSHVLGKRRPHISKYIYAPKASGNTFRELPTWSRSFHVAPDKRRWSGFQLKLYRLEMKRFIWLEAGRLHVKSSSLKC